MRWEAVDQEAEQERERWLDGVETTLREKVVASVETATGGDFFFFFDYLFQNGGEGGIEEWPDPHYNLLHIPFWQYWNIIPFDIIKNAAHTDRWEPFQRYLRLPAWQQDVPGVTLQSVSAQFLHGPTLSTVSDHSFVLSNAWITFEIIKFTQFL